MGKLKNSIAERIGKAAASHAIKNLSNVMALGGKAEEQKQDGNANIGSGLGQQQIPVGQYPAGMPAPYQYVNYGENIAGGVNRYPPENTGPYPNLNADNAEEHWRMKNMKED